MRVLYGPELFWLLMYGAALLVANANVPPSPAVEGFIEDLAYWIVIPVVLTFGLWLVPQVEKNWLLLRVWFACIIGGHVVLGTVLEAHSKQGPGIGTVYIAGMLVIFLCLVVGTLVVALIPVASKLFRRKRHRDGLQM